MRTAAIAVLVLACVACINALLLPPTNEAFKQGDVIKLKVNKIDSPRTQLPFGYYSLPFCRPAKIKEEDENLGEVLLGDRVENSLYTLKVLENKACELLCVSEFKPKQLKRFGQRIREEYRAHWILDGLPAATVITIRDVNTQETKTLYEDGFPIGAVQDNEVYLHNHVFIKILYNHEKVADEPTDFTVDGKKRDGEAKDITIVGFEVVPASIAHPVPKDGENPSCVFENFRPLKISGVEEDLKVVWTYDVLWEPSDRKWVNRWDVYLTMLDPQVHWFSIVNSLMIVVFLSGMVAMIMVRTLRADLRKYNMPMERDEDIQEETGWKLVHGDVFRAPKHRMTLAVFCGTGVQVTLMFAATLVFAVLGFLSPANRGALLSIVPVLFVLFGVYAGYYSATTYKLMGGQEWKKNTLLTAFMLPGIVVTLLLFLNFLLIGVKSSSKMTFGTVAELLAMWFFVSVPLVFLGAYFGYRKPVADFPVRTNLIPRLIPEQVWYLSPIFSILLGGVLPFGVVFIELFFLLTSIWQHQFYYLFSFLFFVFLLLALTSCEISIVMTYFQLCAEDYHWWWRSFLTPGASAFYLLLYAAFYYFTRLHMIGTVSTFIYFGNTAMIALAFFLMTGSFGFFASLYFVRKIYSSVHLA